jgi:hypothetical protein
MPQGGRLRLRTAVADDGAIVPRTALLIVGDTGSGMDEATRARIFEPFFTTKEPGKGTGLGLSTVYGIVTQHHGDIAVASEVGRGTTFTISLPLVLAARPDADVPEEQDRPRGGMETILVVEDDVPVRDLVAETLRRWGYRVIAVSGVEALTLGQAEVERVDLLLTDVIMPEVSGPEVALRLKRRHGALPVPCSTCRATPASS